MNEITDLLIDALRDQESDVGSTLTWSGQELPCSGSESREGKVLTIGGFRFNASVVLVLRIAELDPDVGRPVPKNTLLYVSAPGASARTLRIDTVSTLYNQILVLECNDPNQAA